MKLCSYCEMPFSSSQPQALYCSKRCKWNTKYRRRAEVIARYTRKRYNANIAFFRAQWVQRYHSDPSLRESQQLSAHKRRAHLANAVCEKITAADWEAIKVGQLGRCWWCAEKAKLSKDHVIPISKGGPHTKANIVAACMPCNIRKRAHLWPRHSGRLIKLFKQVTM